MVQKKHEDNRIYIQSEHSVVDDEVQDVERLVRSKIQSLLSNVQQLESTIVKELAN
jgi:hypothetical protein